MKGGEGVLITQTDVGFEVCDLATRRCRPVPVPAGTDRDAVHDAVVQAINELDTSQRVARDNAIIAVASESICFATFATAQIGGSKDDASLLYRFESELPMDAEQIVADYDVSDDVVAAAAVVKADWIDLIAALERNGVQVQHIVSATMLCLQRWVDADVSRQNSLSLWWSHTRGELIRVRDGHVTLWRCKPNDVAEIARELRMVAASDQRDDVVHVVSDLPDPSIRQALTDPSTQPLAIRIETSGAQAMDVVAAASTPTRHRSHRFEFRRGDLAEVDPVRAIRRPLRQMFIAGMIMTAVLAAAALYRTNRYQAITSSLRQDLDDQFRHAFPGQRVPAAVLARLRNEQRVLRGTRSTTDQVAPSVSGIDILHVVLGGMPADVAFEVQQIDVQQERFVIEASIDELAVAGKIAASLQQTGLIVYPPATETTDSGRLQCQIRGELSAELRQRLEIR